MVRLAVVDEEGGDPVLQLLHAQALKGQLRVLVLVRANEVLIGEPLPEDVVVALLQLRRRLPVKVVLRVVDRRLHQLSVGAAVRLAQRVRLKRPALALQLGDAVDQAADAGVRLPEPLQTLLQADDGVVKLSSCLSANGLIVRSLSMGEDDDNDDDIAEPALMSLDVKDECRLSAELFSSWSRFIFQQSSDDSVIDGTPAPWGKYPQIGLKKKLKKKLFTSLNMMKLNETATLSANLSTAISKTAARVPCKVDKVRAVRDVYTNGCV
ncbi:hypothetical protein TYRP_010064 [Tyrophagus putrescentiae]|nr:hypothetical protein TYRP_010064 [Tyrophagus putrescentiae]